MICSVTPLAETCRRGVLLRAIGVMLIGVILGVCPVQGITATVDYQTAHNILITQGLDATQRSDGLLDCLSQGKPPVPGQVTTLLLALKVVFEGLREATQLDRDLAAALFILSTQSRHHFDVGDRAGIEWPPLLSDDLDRIARAVQSIFLGEWLES